MVLYEMCTRQFFVVRFASGRSPNLHGNRCRALDAVHSLFRVGVRKYNECRLSQDELFAPADTIKDIGVVIRER